MFYHFQDIVKKVLFFANHKWSPFFWARGIAT